MESIIDVIINSGNPDTLYTILIWVTAILAAFLGIGAPLSTGIIERATDKIANEDIVKLFENELSYILFLKWGPVLLVVDLLTLLTIWLIGDENWSTICIGSIGILIIILTILWIYHFYKFTRITRDYLMLHSEFVSKTIAGPIWKRNQLLDSIRYVYLLKSIIIYKAKIDIWSIGEYIEILRNATNKLLELAEKHKESFESLLFSQEFIKKYNEEMKKSPNNTTDYSLESIVKKYKWKYDNSISSFRNGIGETRIQIFDKSYNNNNDPLCLAINQEIYEITWYLIKSQEDKTKSRDVLLTTLLDDYYGQDFLYLIKEAKIRFTPLLHIIGYRRYALVRREDDLQSEYIAKFNSTLVNNIQRIIKEDRSDIFKGFVDTIKGWVKDTDTEAVISGTLDSIKEKIKEDKRYSLQTIVFHVLCYILYMEDKDQRRIHYIAILLNDIGGIKTIEIPEERLLRIRTDRTNSIRRFREWGFLDQYMDISFLLLLDYRNQQNTLIKDTKQRREIVFKVEIILSRLNGNNQSSDTTLFQFFKRIYIDTYGISEEAFEKHRQGLISKLEEIKKRYEQ